MGQMLPTHRHLTNRAEQARSFAEIQPVCQQWGLPRMTQGNIPMKSLPLEVIWASGSPSHHPSCYPPPTSVGRIWILCPLCFKSTAWTVASSHLSLSDMFLLLPFLYFYCLLPEAVSAFLFTYCQSPLFLTLILQFNVCPINCHISGSSTSFKVWSANSSFFSSGLDHYVFQINPFWKIVTCFSCTYNSM